MALLGGNDPMTVSRWRWGRQRLRRLQEVDLWIGVSNVFRSSVEEAGPPDGGFRAIHGAVETDLFRPATPEQRSELRRSLQLPVEARIAVSMGSIVHRKGIDRVLEAWSRADPVPNRDLLVLVGPNSLAGRLSPADLPYAEQIEERARARGLDGTVLLVGQVDRPQDYLRAADLSIFLSRREGMGLVIVESMACGLPTIVSPLDGIADEIIEHETTGFIARTPDDGASIGPLLRTLLDHKDLREQVGKAARSATEERFSMAKRARVLAGVYHELSGQAAGVVR
jgi:glycosyltransferase involved in cell wall biosynthesis